jgi:ferric-chelate reductase
VPYALDGSDGPKAKEVTFIIRARDGFTGRMRRAAAIRGTFSVPAFIDGPYGCPPNLSRFSTCVLVSGGSGVSYTLPLLQNLVQ